MFGIDKLRHDLMQLLTVMRQENQAALARLERTIAKMATRDELSQAIGDLGNQIQQVGSDVVAAIDRLQSKINAGQDFQPELDRLRSFGQQLQQTDAAAVAAGQDQLPTPEPVPTPEPAPDPPQGRRR